MEKDFFFKSDKRSLVIKNVLKNRQLYDTNLNSLSIYLSEWFLLKKDLIRVFVYWDIKTVENYGPI